MCIEVGRQSESGLNHHVVNISTSKNDICGLPEQTTARASPNTASSAMAKQYSWGGSTVGVTSRETFIDRFVAVGRCIPDAFVCLGVRDSPLHSVSVHYSLCRDRTMHHTFRCTEMRACRQLDGFDTPELCRKGVSATCISIPTNL